MTDEKIEIDKAKMRAVRERLRERALLEESRGHLSLARWMGSLIADIDETCWPDAPYTKDMKLHDDK